MNHVNVLAISGMRVLVFNSDVDTTHADSNPATCAFVHKNSVELGV